MTKLLTLFLAFAIVCTSCADLEPVDSAAERISRHLQDLDFSLLRTVDPDLVSTIEGLNSTLQQGAKIQIGAEDDLIALAARLNQTMRDKQLSFDDKTLAELRVMTSILERGIKGGLDAETLHELRSLTEVLDRSPEKWQEAMEAIIAKLEQTGSSLTQNLEELMKKATNDLIEMQLILGEELRCNVQFIQRTAEGFVPNMAERSVEAVVGESVLKRLPTFISGQPPEPVFDACHIRPARIDLVRQGDKIGLSDPILEIIGYGFTSDNLPTVEVVNESGHSFAGWPAGIGPLPASSSRIQFNLQGVDFSGIEYRSMLVFTWPRKVGTFKSLAIPIILPAEPTSTPLPAPTATLLPDPHATINISEATVHRYPYVPDWAYVLGRAKQNTVFRVTGKTEDQTWLEIDAQGQLGWIYAGGVSLNVAINCVCIPFKVPPSTPIPQPIIPTSTPLPTIIFNANPVKLTTSGECTTIMWKVENVHAVYLSDGTTDQQVDSQGVVNKCIGATTTFILRVYLPNTTQPENHSVTVEVPIAPPPQVPERPSPQDAYIRLYEHPTFGGDFVDVRLADCGLTNLARDNRLNDLISSFELFAADNVDVILREHQSFHNDFPGRTGQWRGNNDRLQVDIDQLSAHRINDRISSIQWLIDGQPQQFVCEQ